MNYIYRAYKITDSVLRDKAFSTIELNKALKIAPESERAIITKIVYGTLENSVRYDYYIKCLCEKKPKGSIESLIKIGLFLLYELDSVPCYAAIDECVKIAKKISRGSLSGFVNATLRSAVDYEYPAPENREDELSVKYSVPLLIGKKLCDEYGEELTAKMLVKSGDTNECIRSNSRCISGEAFKNTLSAHDIPYKRLAENAFSVRLPDLEEKIDKKLYTCQALSSIYAIDCLDIKPEDIVLDVCSAPGGKAVYASEKAKEVFACDVYDHRVALIESYALRMGAKNVYPMIKNGLKFDKAFENRFDKIICDVPCSGSGVFHSRPDVLFGITESGIVSLNATQYGILETCAKYLKSGGELLYSTCSLFNEENDDIIGRFLKNNDGFVVEPTEVPAFNVKKEYGIELLPNLSGSIGFYIAKIKKL